jgi:purine-binding chemotaxis protein CheW
MEKNKTGGCESERLRKSSMEHLAGKYLTFRLAQEEYGLEILKVREIIGLMNITPVPRAPHEIRGVINLRGKIIPVVDLRRKFGMSDTEATEETCIIVVNVNAGDESVDMGILVDSVSEVLDIKGEDIGPAPSFGKALSTDFILGMAKTGGRVTILLTIERVLTASDFASRAGSAELAGVN